ncbi:hypothetical protein [Novacetimonas hansenii]|uniref:hypothetical protein n=1 Tax=Novacetimonas hansenii TaxID=436 RepID=UPI000AC977D5|nr:hypothetical protein [Novacetimonas hansenii]WEQ57953.1 hypothetical protein LV563_08605 [Novacetimonas hansenii]
MFVELQNDPATNTGIIPHLGPTDPEHRMQNRQQAVSFSVTPQPPRGEHPHPCFAILNRGTAQIHPVTRHVGASIPKGGKGPSGHQKMKAGEKHLYKKLFEKKERQLQTLSFFQEIV